MPKQLRVAKSQRLAVIVSIIGNASLADALHVISSAGARGASVRDVMAGLECSRSRANGLVATLEQAGYISGDPAPDARGARTKWNPTVYRINRRKVRAAIEVFAKHVLSED